ncbi:hypothetical protein K4K60_006622 [Colletotrichum sp. SAR11_57]|nr:hypothetical protein K4K60_006622 [Colletotrichum sp. SAR11_57]
MGDATTLSAMADELDRLDFNASFLTKLTQNQLHHAPLEQGKVHRILDIGTGTVARVPPNVKFEVDDVESPWVAPTYDFIYCRFMAGAIADWPRLVKNTFKNTHPGGWVEFQDWDLLFKSDDGSITDDHYSMKMIKMFMEGSRKVGREPSPGPLLEPLMREAGFVNIHHKQIKCPLGMWPKDPYLRDLGHMNMIQALDGLEAYNLRLYTGVLGWTVAEAQVLFAHVRNEIRNNAFHAYMVYHVVYGQERHQAISYNEDAGTYNFSNIRFAEPPVGDLRFRAPVPVKVSNTSHVVNNGSSGAICPQPFTLFNDTAVTQWILSYISGTVLDLAELQQQAANQTEPPADPRISEDCLFLDVIVPKKIYDNRNSGAGAPVLVWIYGGGYLIGEKTGLGLHNPTGLLQASEDLGDDGFIFVAMNYRLGALGFLGGPTVEAQGTPNAGLYDQRLALEFVKENIHLFGGSPDRVTVMGESAGGGSIIHQLTAFGGDQGPAPFQQIITQSTGFVPARSSQALEDVVETVLSVANVSSFDALRKLPSDVLIAVNNIVTRQLYQGAFHPAVDGVFVPEEPARMLLSGEFDYVRALIGTNANEGILFGDPRINTTEAYSEYVRTLVAGISNDSATALEEEVYPPIFDGSQGYTDNFERAYQSFGEFCFTCNQPFTSRGLGNATYNYQFAAPLGVHGQDLGFTFYRGEAIDPAGAPFPPTTDIDVAVSRVLQSWIASFVTSGVPTALNVIGFEQYGAEGNLLVLGEANNSTHVARGTDPTLARGRCDWLAKRIINQTLLEAN